MGKQTDDILMFNQLLTEKTLPHLKRFTDERLKDEKRWIEARLKRYTKLAQALDSSDEMAHKVLLQKEYKQELLDLLNKAQKQVDNDKDELIKELHRLVKEDTASLIHTIRVKEVALPYTLAIKDNPIKSIRKIWSNTALFFKRKGVAFVNWAQRVFFRKVANREVLKYRRVPYRNMCRYFLNVSLVEQCLPVFDTVFKGYSNTLLRLWEGDNELDEQFHKLLYGDKPEREKEEVERTASLFNTALESNHQNKIEIDEKLKSLVELITGDFAKAIAKVDTIEMPRGFYRHANIERRKTELFLQSAQNFAFWQNTHRTLIDDWMLDVDVTLLYYSVYDEFNLLYDNVGNFSTNNLAKLFAQVKGLLSKIISSVSADKKSKKDMLAIVHQAQGKLSTELTDKLLAKGIEMLTHCFADDFNHLSNRINSLTNDISDHRSFLRYKDYEKATSTSEIKSISPRELLGFEALPKFNVRIGEIWQKVSKQLERARMNLVALGTVCDFSVESALLQLNSKQGTASKARATVVDGFERALSHLAKVEETIQAIQNLLAKDFGETINTFNNDILKLRNTENIIELNLKIAKIKAIERTKELRKKLVIIAKRNYLLIRYYYKRTILLINRRLKRVKKRLGVGEDVRKVSFEISEFIGDTQQSLKGLPFVYQRLFRLSPTNEERFFVNREKELGLLRQSYKDWVKDRFITIAIIGDKGSGVTSLVNMFLNNLEQKEQVTLTKLSYKIYTPEAYYSFFSEMFGAEKFNSNDEIIDFLNNGDSSRIVIIENLQHMFLKQVHGFDCMNLLFDLMANTMKKVLWIGIYTQHSWQYLDKTIAVSNYFTSEVFIEQLHEATIEEIIYKRNALSGFQINFLPDVESKRSKVFKQLEFEEQQNHLQKRFFTILKKLSNGNISLAMLYWLRSIKKVSDDTIDVIPISEVDFSFIKKLSSDELFSLQALILHDGLCFDDFSKVMGKPIGVCRNILNPMLEKGLLIRPHQKFNINPIIFKPVSDYLSMRNFVN